MAGLPGVPCSVKSRGRRLVPSCSGFGGRPAMSMKVGAMSMLEPRESTRVPGLMPGPRARNGMCTSLSYGC